MVGLLAAALGAAACGEAPEAAPVRAVVSVLPHAGLVERIGGTRVAVTTLVAPGESPSTAQPTDADVSDALRAKVYFRTGVPFEHGAWLDLLRAAPGVRVVDLREGVTLLSMEGHGHEGTHGSPDEDGRDPHIWTAPAALEVQARTIARVLEEVDPAGADVYRAGLADVLARLERLDQDLRTILAPVRNHSMFVFHPAWGYLCAAYGIVERPIEVEGKGPSEAELTALLARAREDDVHAVYVQSQIVGQAAEAVARAIGARVVRLDPLARDVIENLAHVGRVLAETL